MSEEEIHEVEENLRKNHFRRRIRCEGFNEDFKDGILSTKELEEEIYQISRKYS